MQGSFWPLGRSSVKYHNLHQTAQRLPDFQYFPLWRNSSLYFGINLERSSFFFNLQCLRMLYCSPAARRQATCITAVSLPESPRPAQNVHVFGPEVRSTSQQNSKICDLVWYIHLWRICYWRCWNSIFFWGGGGNVFKKIYYISLECYFDASKDFETAHFVWISWVTILFIKIGSVRNIILNRLAASLTHGKKVLLYQQSHLLK